MMNGFSQNANNSLLLQSKNIYDILFASDRNEKNILYSYYKILIIAYFSLNIINKQLIHWYYQCIYFIFLITIEICLILRILTNQKQGLNLNQFAY